jgi:hypothetical protein
MALSRRPTVPDGAKRPDQPKKYFSSALTVEKVAAISVSVPVFRGNPLAFFPWRPPAIIEAYPPFARGRLGIAA